MGLISALRIFRPLNIAILALAQIGVYTYLAPQRMYLELLSPVFLKIILASALTAMAGNMYNDLMDLKADEINKPGRNYSVYWPGRWSVRVVFILLNGVSLWLAFSIVKQVGYLFLIVQLLLFLYNVVLKKIAIIGNLVISLITAVSLGMIGWVFGDVRPDLLAFYTGFAFLMTLVRELVKDTEDFEGDLAAGYKTLPVLVGRLRAQRSIGNLCIFAIVLFGSLAFNTLAPYFTGGYRVVVIAYGILCIVAPLVYVLSRSYRNTAGDYSLWSSILKYVMVTGLASMLFF